MAFNIPAVVPGAPSPLMAQTANINSLNQQALNNQILQAQAKYAPYTAYAQALSQMASPANAIGQILSGPGAANINSDTQNSLAGLAQRYLQNYTQMGNGGIPLPNQNTDLLSLLINKLTGRGNINALTQVGSPAPSAPNANGPTPPSSGAVAPTADNPYPIQGAADRDTPAQVDADLRAVRPQGTQGGQFAQQINSQGIPGSIGPGRTASAANVAANAALQTGATAEAANSAKNWQDTFDADKAIADQNRNLINVVNNMIDARSKLQPWEKGPYLGELPGVTSAAQDLDAYQRQAARAVAQAQISGVITNQAADEYSQMKPGRNLNDQSFQDQTNFLKGMSARAQEKQAFDYEAQQKGLSTQQRDLAWQYYNNQEPFYDRSNHQVAYDNLGANVWKNYLGGKRLQDAFNPDKNSVMKSLNGYSQIPTSWKSKEDFQQWYLQQPPQVQQMINQKYGRK